MDLFSSTGPKCSASDLGQIVILPLIMPVDLGDELLKFDLQTKLFLRLTDGRLFGGLALIHMTAWEGEIVKPCAVTFDQRNPVVLHEDNAGSVAHFGKLNSVVNSTSWQDPTSTARDNAGTLLP